MLQLHDFVRGPTSISRPCGKIGCHLVDAWVRMIDLNPSAYGPQPSTDKGGLIYKKTGNPRACQLLLGHGKLESTVRYLGIEVDQALETPEQIDL